MAENNAILSEQEKGRILYHMGYGLVSIADIFALGVPAVSQPMFIAASAVNRIRETQIQIIREIVAQLELIDQQRVDARGRFRAKVLEDIQLNPDEMQMLEQEYKNWANRLSDVLLAPLNPYSARFDGGRQPLNRRVRPC